MSKPDVQLATNLNAPTRFDNAPWREIIRPFRAGIHFDDRTRGVAPGYRILPRWGNVPATVGAVDVRPTVRSDGAMAVRPALRSVGAMNQYLPAPTGHDVKAQGNALGMDSANPPSPERA